MVARLPRLPVVTVYACDPVPTAAGWPVVRAWLWACDDGRGNAGLYRRLPRGAELCWVPAAWVAGDMSEAVRRRRAAGEG